MDATTIARLRRERDEHRRLHPGPRERWRRIARLMSAVEARVEARGELGWDLGELSIGISSAMYAGEGERPESGPGYATDARARWREHRGLLRELGDPEVDRLARRVDLALRGRWAELDAEESA